MACHGATTRTGGSASFCQYKYIVAVVFVVAIFMDLLDLTIVNVALPTLGRQFHQSVTRERPACSATRSRLMTSSPLSAGTAAVAFTIR